MTELTTIVPIYLVPDGWRQLLIGEERRPGDLTTWFGNLFTENLSMQSSVSYGEDGKLNLGENGFMSYSQGIVESSMIVFRRLPP